MNASDVTIVYANDTWAGTWPVFKVCLIAAPVGVLLFWYADRIIDRAPWPMSRLLAVAYWTAGILGALLGGAGGFFGVVAFVVLECNGLSHYWLLIPGTAIAVLLWRVEHNLAQERAKKREPYAEHTDYRQEWRV